MLLQTTITGLAIGGIYALMAVGYSLVFSVLNFSNFAHGSVIMLGAYAGYFVLTRAGASFSVAIAGSMLAGAVLGITNERLAYRPLRVRNARPLYFMISAMGVAIFLENLVYATLGAHFYSYPEVLGRSIVRIGEASIGVLDLFALTFSGVAITGLHLFLHRTKGGLAIRACSFDMTVASVFGVRLDRVGGLVFALVGGSRALIFR